MNNDIVVGIDLAKNVFQVYAENAEGDKLYNRRFTRAKLKEHLAKLPPCLIGMECCGTAHYWGREIQKMGHTVKLIDPRRVKAFVVRNKNDAKDAEAIAEATKSKKVNAIAIKTLAQQHITTLHRARSLIIKQRIQTSNHLRSQLAEYGLTTRKGFKALDELAKRILSGELESFPEGVLFAFQDLHQSIIGLSERLAGYDEKIKQIAKTNKTAKQLMEMPGVGEIIATAIVAKVEDVSKYGRAKDFAASFGLTPKEYSSADTRRLGKISKQGDRYIRALLIHGARSSIKATLMKDKRETAYHRWIQQLVVRVGWNKAVVALANKHARMMWALMRHDRRIDLDFSLQSA